MSTIWYTSDTHFSHERMAKIWRVRTFETVLEHDEYLVEQWNKQVSTRDTVFHLGDVALSSEGLAWMGRLNGTIHLITGNHDGCFPGHRESFKSQKKYRPYFDSIQPFLIRKIDGRQVLLSHFPYEGDHVDNDRTTQYRLRDEGIPLLHGHTHENNVITHSNSGTLQIHVGLDAWDLKLVPMDEIVSLLQNWEK